MDDLFEQLPHANVTWQEKVLRELYRKVQEQDEKIKSLEGDVYRLQRHLYDWED